jgi:hypothetical protein
MMRSSTKGMEFAGPIKWASIHITCASYTPDKCVQIKKWIELEFELLPCKECRAHAAEMLKKYPIKDYLTNNERLLFWSYIIHDEVNHRLHKKSPPWDEIKRYYLDALGSDCTSCNV